LVPRGGLPRTGAETNRVAVQGSPLMIRLLSLLTATVIVALFCGLPAPTGAQEAWPSKPIKLIVPYPPGGAADVVGRLYADKLTEALKQPVLVENKPGAGTAIAAEYVAAAAPDGYTLSVVPTGQLTILPHLAKDLRFDPINGFTPISQLAYTGVVIAAAANFPASTLKEYVAAARAKPGEVSYSSSGSSTIIHLAGEYFALATGTQLLHVPFKGSAPAVTALLGGEVNSSFDTLTILAPQIKAGKVKGLAIASRERSPLLPDVPTVAESGYPDFEVTSWFGLAGPAGMPREIVSRLNAELTAISKQPAVRESLAQKGLTAWPSTPEQFGERIEADRAKYGEVVRKARIKFE
jgi:tripartite-type tricarboxylate transporter receptor subunit TctC